MNLLAGLWASALTSGLSLGLWIARGCRAALLSRDLELRGLVCASCLFTVKRSDSQQCLKCTQTVCHTCMRLSEDAGLYEQIMQNAMTETCGAGTSGKPSNPQGEHQDILGNIWEKTLLNCTWDDTDPTVFQRSVALRLEAIEYEPLDFSRPAV